MISHLFSPASNSTLVPKLELVCFSLGEYPREGPKERLQLHKKISWSYSEVACGSALSDVDDHGETEPRSEVRVVRGTCSSRSEILGRRNTIKWQKAPGSEIPPPLPHEAELY
jgi:hypothetical protein